MTDKLNTLSQRQRHQLDEDARRAYDFDPADPMYGLSKTELGGPELDRRTVC